jgi:ABC-type polar amino acid transport system ATPase subunit
MQSSVTPLIEAQNLVKAFGRIRALDDASCTISTGERLVVIGPSGSGKSTLIRCLNGLVKPDTGKIAFEGQHIELTSEAHWRRLRQRVGMVFQDYTLFPHLTAIENITLAPVRAGLMTKPHTAGGEGGLIPSLPLRRPATASRDRTGARDAPADSALRRANVGTRP